MSPTDPASFTVIPLTDDAKYILLSSTAAQSSRYVYPVTAGRKFNESWLASRPSLRYSKSHDAIYCISCICFSCDRVSPFVSGGYKDWKRATGKESRLDSHTRNNNHLLPDEQVACFIRNISKNTNIKCMLNSQILAYTATVTKGILCYRRSPQIRRKRNCFTG